MLSLKAFLILTFISFTSVYSQTENQIPMKDFFKNPEKVGYRISPNGEYFSYLGPYENRLNIFVENLKTGDSKRITSETSRDITQYFLGE